MVSPKPRVAAAYELSNGVRVLIGDTGQVVTIISPALRLTRSDRQFLASCNISPEEAHHEPAD